MANLPETSQWEEGIYQWEVDDPLEGGVNGVDNKPIRLLANRTRFLYDRQNVLIDENGAFGYEIPFEFEPTPLQLALWRCLPLQGQIVQISLYQRLCDAKYVGNSANATADWWYKCNSAGTRSTTGAYMRVLDHRGVYTRPAGQNSLYKMANDTPYDGNAIGTYLEDAIRDIIGSVTFNIHSADWTSLINSATGVFHKGYYDNLKYINNLSVDEPGTHAGFDIDVSRIVPTALENRPASISAYLCIKY